MGKQKEYSNDEITVVWKPDLCIHSAKCAIGLPRVFQPKERPWVKMDAAETKSIMATVDRCPSGALSYYMNEAEEMSNDSNSVKVNIYSEGPYVIEGEVCLVHPDGTEEVKSKAALCRCGHSANKPFCDGAHKGSGFDQ